MDGVPESPQVLCWSLWRYLSLPTSKAGANLAPEGKVSKVTDVEEQIDLRSKTRRKQSLI